jgi:hypothetical protein
MQEQIRVAYDRHGSRRENRAAPTGGRHPIALQRCDVRGLEPLRAAFRFVADFLALSKRLEASAAHLGEVCEQVIPSLVRRNEAKALAIVEPFNGTGFH